MTRNSMRSLAGACHQCRGIPIRFPPAVPLASTPPHASAMLMPRTVWNTIGRGVEDGEAAARASSEALRTSAASSGNDAMCTSTSAPGAVRSA